MSGSEAHSTRGETEAQGEPASPRAQTGGRTSGRSEARSPRAAPARPGPTNPQTGCSSPPLRAATPALPPPSPPGPAARGRATPPSAPASVAAPCWPGGCHLSPWLRGSLHVSAGPCTQGGVAGPLKRLEGRGLAVGDIHTGFYYQWRRERVVWNWSVERPHQRPEKEGCCRQTKSSRYDWKGLEVLEGQLNPISRDETPLVITGRIGQNCCLRDSLVGPVCAKNKNRRKIRRYLLRS